MQTVNYGLIGCGMMGQEHMRNIALLAGARVAAIFDPDDEQAGLALKIAPNAKRLASLQDLLEFPELDALVIASPNFLHISQLVEIGRKRPLPVLVEKPLFTQAADRSMAADLAASYPAPIWVAMEYRYMPPLAEFLKALPEATGGPIMLTIREHRFPFLHKVAAWNRFNEQSGGTLVEKCCHFFDLMRLIMDAHPVRVMASGGQAVNHLQERYGGLVPDIWDHAYVIVEFDNGSRAMLELSMFAEGSDYQEELTAVGPKGKIQVRIPGPQRFWPSEAGPPPVADLTISPRQPKAPIKRDIPVDPTLLEAGDHNGATYYQHLKFLKVIRGQAQPEVTLEHGALAVELGIAAQHSAATGQAVGLLRSAGPGF